MILPTPHRMCSRSPLVPRVARHGRRLVGVACLAPLAACYSTRAVTGAPPAGATVLLDLNDLARVQLGEQIGPSASRIDGVLQSWSDSAYVIRIASVSYLNGQSNKWSGESFTVRTRLVARARAREFSRSRTTALSVGIAAVLAAVFATTDFFGLAGPQQQPTPPPGGET